MVGCSLVSGLLVRSYKTAVRRLWILNRSDKIDYASAYLAAFDSNECCAQVAALEFRQEFHHALISLDRHILAGLRLRLFIKILDRNTEDDGDVEQAPGTDSIAALLVFLNLLEGKAQQTRQMRLSHTDKQTSQSSALSQYLLAAARGEAPKKPAG